MQRIEAPLRSEAAAKGAVSGSTVCERQFSTLVITRL